MSIILDTTIDAATWVNVEQITYTSLGYTDPVTFQQLQGPTALIPVAKRQTVTQAERMASGGRYTSQDRTWRIPKALLPPNIVPRPGDQIIGAQSTEDTPDVWTVLDTGRPDAAATWRLTCRNLVIAFGLNDRIDIERSPQHLVNAAGAPVQIWPSGPQPLGGTVAYRNLRCVVQPETMDSGEERGIRGPQTRYKIVVERQLLVTTYDRVRWLAGAGRETDEYLEIERYENAMQIDELSVLYARRSP